MGLWILAVAFGYLLPGNYAQSHEYSSFVFIKEECDLGMRISLAVLHSSLVCAQEAQASNLSNLNAAWDTLKSNHSEIANLRSSGFEIEKLANVICNQIKVSPEKTKDSIGLIMGMTSNLDKCRGSKLTAYIFNKTCLENSAVMIKSMNLLIEHSDFMKTVCDSKADYRGKKIEESCKSKSLDTFENHITYLICRFTMSQSEDREIYRTKLSMAAETSKTGSAQSPLFISQNHLVYFALLQMTLQRIYRPTHVAM